MAMNPQHEMLMDTLKGHSYKMSPWQYYEVQEHYDHEMRWIIREVVSKFCEKIRDTTPNNTYKIRDLFSTVGEETHRILAERENHKLPTNSYEITRELNQICNDMLTAYCNMYPGDSTPKDKGQNTYDIVDDFIIYAIDRSLRIIRNNTKINDK